MVKINRLLTKNNKSFVIQAGKLLLVFAFAVLHFLDNISKRVIALLKIDGKQRHLKSLKLTLTALMIIALLISSYFITVDQVNGKNFKISDILSFLGHSNPVVHSRPTRKSIKTFASKQTTYKTKDGKVKTIDTKIRKAGGGLIVDKTPYKLNLAKKASEGSVFSSVPADTSTTVKISNVGAAGVNADVNKDTAVYKAAYANTDITQQAIPSGLKETIILNAPGHPMRFSETLETQMKLEPQKDGSIILLDGGKKVSFIPRPYLTDAKGKTLNLRYRVIDGQNSKTLQMDLPSLKGLAYPIKIDPTIITYSANDLASWAGDYVNYYPAIGAIAQYTSSGTLTSWPIDSGLNRTTIINQLSWSEGNINLSWYSNSLEFQVAVNNDNAT